MSLVHWLELDGCELINGCRAKTYSQLANASITVLDDCDICCCESFDCGFTDPWIDRAWWVDEGRPESFDYLGFLPSSIEWVSRDGIGGAELQVFGRHMARTPAGLNWGMRVFRKRIKDGCSCADRSGKIMTHCDTCAECADSGAMTFGDFSFGVYQKVDDGFNSSCMQSVNFTLVVDCEVVTRSLGCQTFTVSQVLAGCPLTGCTDIDLDCAGGDGSVWRPPAPIDVSGWCEPWDQIAGATKICVPSGCSDFQLGIGIMNTGDHAVRGGRVLIWRASSYRIGPQTSAGRDWYLQNELPLMDARIQTIPSGGTALAGGPTGAGVVCAGEVVGGVTGAGGSSLTTAIADDGSDIWVAAYFDQCDAGVGQIQVAVEILESVEM